MKKKVLIGLGSVVCIFIIIGIIAVVTATEEPAQTEPAQTESAQTEPAQQEEEATQPTTPEKPALTTAEQAYLTTISNHVCRMTDTMVNLSELFSDFQIGDDVWTIQVAAQLVTIQMLYDEVLEIEPPSSMTHIHSKYVQAMKHFETATHLISQGIDRLDSDLINQATAEISAGTQLINESTNLLTAFSEERSSE